MWGAAASRACQGVPTCRNRAPGGGSGGSWAALRAAARPHPGSLCRLPPPRISQILCTQREAPGPPRLHTRGRDRPAPALATKDAVYRRAAHPRPLPATRIAAMSRQRAAAALLLCALCVGLAGAQLVKTRDYKSAAEADTGAKSLSKAVRVAGQRRPALEAPPDRSARQAAYWTCGEAQGRAPGFAESQAPPPPPPDRCCPPLLPSGLPARCQ